MHTVQSHDLESEHKTRNAACIYIYIMYVYDVYRFLRYRIIWFFKRFRGSSNLLIIADPCCFEAQMERRDSKEPTENWASKVMKAPTAS